MEIIIGLHLFVHDFGIISENIAVNLYACVCVCLFHCSIYPKKQVASSF